MVNIFWYRSVFGFLPLRTLKRMILFIKWRRYTKYLRTHLEVKRAELESWLHHFFPFFKDFIYFWKEGEGRETEGERNINVWLPLGGPSPGTWPITQACALTETRTSDALVCRPMLNPLSHTSQVTPFSKICDFGKLLHLSNSHQWNC